MSTTTYDHTSTSPDRSRSCSRLVKVELRKMADT